eukprot:COSAG06_NODE_50757_length_316_cov_1.105991_1_plen_48_part_10
MFACLPAAERHDARIAHITAITARHNNEGGGGSGGGGGSSVKSGGRDE